MRGREGNRRVPIYFIAAKAQVSHLHPKQIPNHTYLQLAAAKFRQAFCDIQAKAAAFGGAGFIASRELFGQVSAG